MLIKQLEDVLSELPDTEEKTLQSYDDAVLCLKELESACVNAEKNLPPLLDGIRERRFIAPATLRDTALCISALYSKAELLEAYGNRRAEVSVEEGMRLKDIIGGLETLKAFEGKMDILVKMGYVRFADRDTDSVYDPVRLGLKRIAVSRKDEDGLLERAETLGRGFETDNQADMVGIFQALSGKFDARILSNILVKNFSFHKAGRDILIRGFGLNDEKFLSLVYDTDGPYEKYFSTGTVFIPEEESTEPEREPAYEPEGTCEEASSREADAEPEEDTESTLPEKHPEEDAKSAPEKTEKTGKTEKSEKAEGNSSGQSAQPKEGAKKTAKKNGTASGKTPAKHVKGEITVIEGRPKKAFEDSADEPEAMPDGFFIGEDSYEKNTSAMPDEDPSVSRAYALLETEDGADAALACIGEAAEADENLIFIEEQMQYAFGAADTYSYDRLVEVFGETEDNADLFGAAVLAYAFSPDPVYDFDYRHTAELVEKKFSDREVGDGIRSVFYTLCRFKEENGEGMAQCMSDGDAARELSDKMAETKRKAADFRKTVSAAYQPNNPFLEIMARVGYTEIYELLDAFADGGDIGGVYEKIGEFLTENSLVCEDRKNGETVPDMNGIDAYKDTVWYRYGETQEGRKQRYNLSNMNDFGKSKNVNRLYKTGVSLLIECMRTAGEFVQCNTEGYEKAKKEAPDVIRRLRDLSGNGYRAIDYMADRYIGMLEEG